MKAFMKDELKSDNKNKFSERKGNHFKEQLKQLITFSQIWKIDILFSGKMQKRDKSN